MMITAQQLESAGYRKYPERFKQYSKWFYQKRFDDEHGKKYFIQFYEYDNREYLSRNPHLPDFSYSSDAQFNDGRGNTFNVECLTNDSIEQVEEFFDRVWKHMSCYYYEVFGE